MLVLVHIALYRNDNQMSGISIGDLAYLTEGLDAIANQKPYTHFQFERLYRAAYDLTLYKEHSTIDLLLKCTSEKVARFENDDDYASARLLARDVFLFPNNTIFKKRNVSVFSVFDDKRKRLGKRVPETPKSEGDLPSERRSFKRVKKK